jgi:hypothetical protein
MTNNSMCASCRFWKQPDAGPGVGQCRKHPPVPFMLIMGPPKVSDEERKILSIAGARPAPQQQTLNFPSAWPPTPGDGWCGEWEEEPIV